MRPVVAGGARFIALERGQVRSLCAMTQAEGRARTADRHVKNRDWWRASEGAGRPQGVAE